MNARIPDQSPKCSSEKKNTQSESNTLKTLDYLQTGILLYNSQSGLLFKNKYLENKFKPVCDELDLNYIEEALDLIICKTDSSLSMREYIRNNYEQYTK